MTIPVIFLGKTNVAFFPVFPGIDNGITRPSPGFLGGLESIGESFGINAQPTPALTVDVSIREIHSLQANITRFPVEFGASITDHIINQPRTLTIDGLISDTPSGLVALVVPGLVTGLVSTPPGLAAFDTMKSWWGNKQILDVQTGLDVYTNMVIRNFSFPKDANTGRALRFSLSLEEIIRVSSAIEQSSSVMDGAGPEANLGQTPTSVVPL